MTPRKVIIDCDPGIDDAVALTLALFDPRLEVVAVTATGGNVSSEKASHNLQALIEFLDPPRLPRIGMASTAEGLVAVDARHIHGEDGLGNSGLQGAALARQHPSEKILCDEIRAAEGEATLICLGPLTNLALALRLEPDLPSLLRQVIILGGSLSGMGNITPCAEFNIYCDPASARAIFRSSLATTLIPLEVTTQLTWSMDLIEKLPAESTRAGKLLRQMLPFLFRSYHQHLGREGIHLHDIMAVALAAHPELFTLEAMAGDVETKGELTTGMTVFDRRLRSRSRGSMEVAIEADVPGIVDYTLRGLFDAGEATK